MYRKLAEIAAWNICVKAHKYIEGKLQIRQVARSQGQDRYTTEIIADQLQM